MNKSILFFIPKLKTGGAENLTIVLANSLVDLGYKVKIIVISNNIDNAYKVNKKIEIITLNYNRSIFALFKIISFLLNQDKMICFTSLRHLNLIVILSNLFTFRKHKVIAIETNTFSNHKNINKDLFKFYFFSFLTQLLYPFANSVIVPSMGIEKEIKKYFF